MLDNNITGATFRTGTVYIGDIGATTSTLEVTGAILKAEAINLTNNITEVEITVDDGGVIPLLFFSILDVGENSEKTNVSIVTLKNQTATKTKMQLVKQNQETTDITLNIFCKND